MTKDELHAAAKEATKVEEAARIVYNLLEEPLFSPEPPARLRARQLSQELLGLLVASEDAAWQAYKDEPDEE